MELVWIVILTTEHGGRKLASFHKQIVIPHQYETEHNCREAGHAVISADIDKKHAVFTYNTTFPDGRSYHPEYGLNADCLPVLVDG